MFVYDANGSVYAIDGDTGQLGVGQTEREAQSDLRVVMEYYHQTLIEHRNRLSPRMARHLALLAKRTERPSV